MQMTWIQTCSSVSLLPLIVAISKLFPCIDATYIEASPFAPFSVSRIRHSTRYRIRHSIRYNRIECTISYTMSYTMSHTMSPSHTIFIAYEIEDLLTRFPSVGCLNNDRTVMSKAYAWRPLVLLPILKASASSLINKDLLRDRRFDLYHRSMDHIIADLNDLCSKDIYHRFADNRIRLS